MKKKNRFWDDDECTDFDECSDFDVCSEDDEEPQSHVHEFLGSTKLAEEEPDRHNHRFAGVTCQAKPFKGSHVHEIRANTDFVDHFHQLIFRTGPAIILNPEAPIEEQKHVHFQERNTTVVDEHCHVLVFATLIEAPLLPMEECER